MGGWVSSTVNRYRKDRPEVADMHASRLQLKALMEFERMASRFVWAIARLHPILQPGSDDRGSEAWSNYYVHEDSTGVEDEIKQLDMLRRCLASLLRQLRIDFDDAIGSSYKNEANDWDCQVSSNHSDFTADD
ncbi:unnamed protein product [Echinostoma caproni]|uniref:Uncharacterized protein n=1 Tax=Echinostoma caproni TaxID=27848 RepID=A0A183AS64_9TREM|nr:unnamed protein product [Echinostoma caproni]